jgi:hypothetical protein
MSLTGSLSLHFKISEAFMANISDLGPQKYVRPLARSEFTEAAYCVTVGREIFLTIFAT